MGCCGSKKKDDTLNPPERADVRPSVGMGLKALDDGFGGKDNVLVVHSVAAGGPADKAGIQVDDKVLSWNQQSLTSMDDFRKIFSSARVGETVKFTVERGGREMVKEFSLTATTQEVAKYQAASPTSL
eukprot:NODE_5880_length_629_cov_37.462069_g5483_i0.p1 GENE.NODE_5880_length_629_cov_37.462069_g5483_i0~~NODE_5880_length_629_cov_37.462069_g5483_i0.p1  ORF type:complete len:128 (-),score=29.58 NODE_5880_length_629_cov_37.462069_g5483_i0:189-572(-)